MATWPNLKIEIAGYCTVDCQKQLVWKKKVGTAVEIPERLLNLLLFLYDNKNHFLTIDQLCDMHSNCSRVDDSEPYDEDTIRKYISQLRKMIGDEPPFRVIENKRGCGYKLNMSMGVLRDHTQKELGVTSMDDLRDKLLLTLDDRITKQINRSNSNGIRKEEPIEWIEGEELFFLKKQNKLIKYDVYFRFRNNYDNKDYIVVGLFREDGVLSLLVLSFENKDESLLDEYEYIAYYNGMKCVLKEGDERACSIADLVMEKIRSSTGNLIETKETTQDKEKHIFLVDDLKLLSTELPDESVLEYLTKKVQNNDPLGCLNMALYWANKNPYSERDWLFVDSLVRCVREYDCGEFAKWWEDQSHYGDIRGKLAHLLLLRNKLVACSNLGDMESLFSDVKKNFPAIPLYFGNICD